ncbi:hypothetical protein [Luteimonas arsenica]|uniref:hypothetical protein n=1 Tax=Luteimonas arsenica TaxID=1586242 RepID=UPI0010546179|nr:hypothetical protein [Luteimonas arsenica]
MHPTIDGSSTLHVVPLRHEPAPADGTVMPVDHGSKPADAAGDPGTAEHTDQAHAEWQEAEQAAADAPPHDYTAVSSAREKREAFETAVRAEIEALPDFVGPVAGGTGRIEAKSGPVLQRYADDPAALDAVNGVVAELEALQPLAQRPAVERLLNEAKAQPDAESVVETLAEGLDGLSESDRAYLTTSPELATLIRENVEPWVSGPYSGLQGDALLTATAAANESSRRLQALTEGLPPDLAYGVVLGNLDTIQNIAQLKPMYLGNPSAFGGEAFGRLSDAVAALGDTPEGNALRADIATLFVAGGIDRGQGGPLATVMADAVRNGSSPGLALEIIEQLPDVGEGDLAEVATTKLVEAGESLADDIAGDLEDYNEMLAELGILLKRNEGLPAEATDAAIQAWLDGQDPEWQSDFEALEGRLIERAETMRELLAGVAALPDDAKGDIEGELKDLFNREDVLDAVNLAASRDRSFLTGPEADLMIALADPARAGAAGADTLRQIGNHAIQQQASLIFADLEHGNPASATAAKAELRALGDRVAVLFGGDADAYRQAIGALDGFADLPANATAAQVEAAATRLDSALGRIEGFGRDSAPGVLLRSLGVAAGVLALNKYASQAVDDPTLRDQVATLGAASGLGSATIALLQKPGSVDVSGVGALDDARGRLGPLGLANWGKALGVFSAVGDLAYMVDAIREGEGVEAGLHALAGAGTVVLSVASGPVGWIVGGSMIALSMFGQASLAGFHEGQEAREASIDYLVAAGLERDVAELLADTGETQGGPAVPAVPLILETARFGGLVGHEGKRMTAEETIEALNAMSGDADQLNALQAQVNQLRYANQHLLLGGG